MADDDEEKSAADGAGGENVMEFPAGDCFHRHAPPHFAGFYTIKEWLFRDKLLISGFSLQLCRALHG